MTKIKPSDIKFVLEGYQGNKAICFQTIRLDINQRLSELLNIREEHTSFSVPDLPEFLTKKNSIRIRLYKLGFRDGEEAHKKKTRELFTKNG